MSERDSRFQYAEEGISGSRKAAVLMMWLGKERSSKILKLMNEHEVTLISSEIAKAGPISSDQAEAVIDEFAMIATQSAFVAYGGIDLARDLLELTVGSKRAREILERLSSVSGDAPFSFLRKADPRQLLSFLREEHPQIISVILTYLSPVPASVVLAGLPPEVQQDVARRIATLDRVPPESLQALDRSLSERLGSVLQTGLMAESSSTGGVQALVDILNNADRTTELAIFDGLTATSPELAEQVRELMFVFEDITSLDDRAVQMVLRQVDMRDLAVALKGVREEVRDKITKNMSERAGENLAEEIQLLGPVRAKQVADAQSSIVRVIRSLEESGEITVTRGSEEFVT